MYESVLVPTDGNRRMPRVIEDAVSLAALCNGTVHALHAVDDAAYASIPEEARDVVRERLREDGEDATRQVAKHAIDSGVDVVREVRTGPPAHVIVSYAVENDVDLIVMGTNGRTGYERYLLGSVAERVVRSAPMAVMTIDLDGDTDAVGVIEEGLPAAIDADRTGDRTDDEQIE
ncbi:universal stress protein [Salinadaptatus halalkaliphilus]|uniref:Universal stress protein n=1 Tax=Salinadaptatus halalkaliphilus TaxID=2419781 RepID=A0A4S3TP26_9EURY|nr:universal stress protein [Salinadaptatus halalkaliphilus]THE66074.1 universal stress protein [Salinadaptatus halalkaliphilus]